MDVHTIDAIALEYAGGMPKKALVAQFGLTSQAVLNKLLQSRKFQVLVEGHREALQHSVAVNLATRQVRSTRVLESLYHRAMDVSDRDSARIAMWYVDGATPREPLRVDHNFGQLSGEVAVDLTKSMEKLFSVRPAQVGIEDEDRHLRFGKEVMEERDQGLALLGTGGEEER